MLRHSITQLITKNESYYSLVIGVAKRARQITEELYEENEKEKNKEVKENTAIATNHEFNKVKEEPSEMKKPVQLAVDDIASGRYKIVEPAQLEED